MKIRMRRSLHRKLNCIPGLNCIPYLTLNCIPNAQIHLAIKLQKLYCFETHLYTQECTSHLATIYCHTKRGA